MDREQLADIVHAMQGLPDVALYDLGARVVLGVPDSSARSHAAARLTALPPTVVEVLIQPSSMPAKFVATPAELSAASRRAQERRTEWETFTHEVHACVSTRARRAIFVVARDARSFAAALRAASQTPLITYEKNTSEHVEELLVNYNNLNVVVLEPELPGTERIAEWLGRTWPWIPIVRLSGAREDVECALFAGGFSSRASIEREGVLDGVRVLVVDVRDGSLEREVMDAAHGATIESATGWEAIERLGEGEVDLVVSGDPEDISLPTLVRFVQRCKSTPLLVIATNHRWRSKMQTAYPLLARYFVERPLCADDLLRALRR